MPDFDGIASIINVYNIIKNPEQNFMYFVVTYNSIEKVLNKVKKEEFDVLWILDINLTEEQLDIIKTFVGYKRIIHIDHHEYEYSVQDYMEGYLYHFVHDPSISACLATNNFIKSRWPKAQQKCEEFSILGNIYDTWIRSSPRFKEAYSINDLYWEYKYEKFFMKFRKGYKLDKEDISTIQSINTERHVYEMDTIKNHIIYNKKVDIAFVLNPKCKHINHITLTIDAKFFVILKEINEDSLAYSVRIYDPEFDLTLQDVFAIIKNNDIEVISSGGHAKVGGIEILKKDNSKFLDTINLIFEGNYDR